MLLIYLLFHRPKRMAYTIIYEAYPSELKRVI